MKKVLLVIMIMSNLMYFVSAGQDDIRKSKLRFLSSFIAAVTFKNQACHKRQKSVESRGITSPVSIIEIIENNNLIQSLPSINSLPRSQQSLTDCHVPDPDTTTPVSSVTDFIDYANQHCKTPDCGSPTPPLTPSCTPTISHVSYSLRNPNNSPILTRKRSMSDFEFFLGDLDTPSSPERR